MRVRVYVARPNDEFHYNGREKRDLQNPPTFAGIGLAFERANPGTRESHINERGLTVYLVDAKQKAKRFGGIRVCAHDEPEGGSAWSAIGRPKHASVPHQCRILARLLYSEGENAVASGSRFV